MQLGCPYEPTTEMSMKKLCLLVVSMILLFFCSLAWGVDLPWEMKLPFKEATIHYELTGSEQGKETLYIKEYGKLRAKHRQATATMMGMTKKTETVEIIDPDWMYTYDLVDKKGEKTTNPRKIYLTEYNKFNGEEKKNFEKNAKELGTSMMGQFGGSVQQKAGKILGYDCDITTVGGMSTVHLLHGTDIPLRSEVAIMGMNSTNAATKIDTSAAIPGSAFAPPQGIDATLNHEAENMMAGMIQQTMDTLKKPDGAKQMQAAGPMGMMGAGGMEQGMKDEGMSPEEQQEMMRQMNEAMQQMQKNQPKK
jgi:hypothetical protein